MDQYLGDGLQEELIEAGFKFRYVRMHHFVNIESTLEPVDWCQ